MSESVIQSWILLNESKSESNLSLVANRIFPLKYLRPSKWYWPCHHCNFDWLYNIFETFPKCEHFCNCGFQHLCQWNLARPPRYICWQNIPNISRLYIVITLSICCYSDIRQSDSFHLDLDLSTCTLHHPLTPWGSSHWLSHCQMVGPGQTAGWCRFCHLSAC